MAKSGRDKDYVSFWFWFFALFLMALPCIGVVIIILWALVGENESRKNYFRALIAWFVILTVFWTTLALLGFGPVILKQLQLWLHSVAK